MPVTHFPDPREADDEGLVAIGGDLHPESLLLAYRSGIFPWPIAGGKQPMTWFSPNPRAILEFDRLHVPRSLERVRKHSSFLFTVDEDFEAVIRACARIPRPGQRGTWIFAPMVTAYQELHRQGHAHSIEVWEVPGDGPRTLVGGVYGVDVDGVFAGESMFHLRPNASKLALLHLAGILSAANSDWMDIQMLTPHMAALGAREIPREEFLERLRVSRERGFRPFGKLRE
jgi:leucyl/phenylalanyl-tRNA---protein transferase